MSYIIKSSCKFDSQCNIFAAEYEVGTPAPNTPCSFTIRVEAKRSGNILSPTYPGTYPKNLTCSYQFIGESGQRVRLEFRDFDLFFGGPQYVCKIEFFSDFSNSYSL